MLSLHMYQLYRMTIKAKSIQKLGKDNKIGTFDRHNGQLHQQCEHWQVTDTDETSEIQPKSQLPALVVNSSVFILPFQQ